MSRLVTVAAFVAAATLSAGARVAAADGVESSVVVEQPGPSTMEAGIYVGGFVSNYFHQFYDDTKLSAQMRAKLDDVAPSFGARYAVFPNSHFGIEGEGGVALEATDTTGDAVTIYRLGLQAMLQIPARVTPFIGVGFGMWHSTSDSLGDATHFPIHAGVGARFFATNTIALRVDARLYRGPSSSDPYTLNASYGEFSVGMSWIPTSRAAVVEVVKEDPDPDHDGVIGAADQCPTEYGTNPDGCPTRDKDGDGIPDAKDKCPGEPETINGYMDDDGCPDAIPDSDGDGINDLTDKCKDEPEDKDGFQDADGCPDLDNDNDGVTDAKDRCPSVAGVVENDGCPDTDKDNDGVVDRLDNCPDEAGVKENHGCPKKKKELVEITKDKLVILDTVRFQTGTAKLSPQSNALLDNIARVMNSHPDVRVHVDGHTDNQGKADANQTLSENRAKAVVDYLVNKGKVDAGRLESAGHGQDQPIGDNKTPKGREQNRRVEFNIIHAAPPGPPAPPGKLERPE